MAALFVAQVKGFAARIAHRVIVPGREAELVGVLAPGVGRAVLREHRPKVWIRQHVDPRRGRRPTGRGRHDVLAPIRGEAPQAVVEDQIATRQPGGDPKFGARVPGRPEARNGLFQRAAPVELFRQRAPAVGEDGARDRLEQNAVLA